eukprot:12217554-Alexandrium_andersonii.AAC.1
MSASLVGSEMCIRDRRVAPIVRRQQHATVVATDRRCTCVRSWLQQRPSPQQLKHETAHWLTYETA